MSEYCSICLTKEELLDEEATKLLVEKVPMLTRLFKEDTKRVCIGCIERFVKIRFVEKRKTIRFEEIQRMLYENGVKCKFVDVLRAAMESGLSMKISIRKTEWSKEMRREQRRRLKRLSVWDATNRRYEEFESMRVRKVAKKRESVTLDKIKDVLSKAVENNEVVDKMQRLLEFQLKRIRGEEFEYDYRVVRPTKGFAYESLEVEPCRLCREVICPKECEKAVLYRRVALVRRYGEFEKKYVLDLGGNKNERR